MSSLSDANAPSRRSGDSAAFSTPGPLLPVGSRLHHRCRKGLIREYSMRTREVMGRRSSRHQVQSLEKVFRLQPVLTLRLLAAFTAGEAGPLTQMEL